MSTQQENQDYLNEKVKSHYQGMVANMNQTEKRRTQPHGGEKCDVAGQRPWPSPGNSEAPLNLHKWVDLFGKRVITVDGPGILRNFYYPDYQTTYTEVNGLNIEMIPGKNIVTYNFSQVREENFEDRLKDFLVAEGIHEKLATSPAAITTYVNNAISNLYGHQVDWGVFQNEKASRAQCADGRPMNDGEASDWYHREVKKLQEAHRYNVKEYEKLVTECKMLQDDCTFLRKELEYIRSQVPQK